MASPDVVTHASLPTKSTTNTSLLSKLTRSPTSSRKHRTTSSVNSSGSDTISDQIPSVPPTSHPQRSQSRPGNPRNTTAPVAPTLNLPKEGALPRTYSDGTGSLVSQATTLRSEVSSATSLKPPGSRGTMSGVVADIAPPSQFSAGPQSVNYLYQQFQDLSHKRIATLNYMRKTHEGMKFWFNTIQFTKADISRLPTYTPARLGRRAMSYLLLGLSIPAVLDIHPQPHPNNPPSVNAALAVEYLRTLNILFTEFESYQQLHPSDGSHVSSLTRARLPSMFKRSATTSRPRKSSGAPGDTGQASSISPPAMPDMPHPPQLSVDTSNTLQPAMGNMMSASPAGSAPPAGFSTSSAFPSPGPSDAANSTLLPNEGPYTHLLTPPLPFTPDFYSVFATVCDVLVDVYQRLLQMIHSSAVCTATVAESFSKVDAKIRKVMVGGVVRDFESAARENAKRELLGVQKVVLGGLMGA